MLSRLDRLQILVLVESNSIALRSLYLIQWQVLKCQQSYQKFSQFESLRLSAALQVLPQFHDLSLALATLSQRLAIECKGKRLPTKRDLNCWLRDLNPDDPPEDVFLGNITAPFPHNLRVFLGQQAMADRILEDILIALANLTRQEPRFEQALSPVLNIIKMTDAIAERLRIDRYATSERCPDTVKIKRWREIVPALEAVVFTDENLGQWGIDEKDLNTFISSEICVTNCPANVESAQFLARYPVIREGNKWLLSLPSCVHETVIRFLCDWLAASGDAEPFNRVFADIQWHRLVHDAIPLLGLRQRRWPGSKPNLPAFVYSVEVADMDSDLLCNLVFIPAQIEFLSDCFGQSGFRLPPDKQAILTEFLGSCFNSLRLQFAHSNIFTVIVLGNLGMGFSLIQPDAQPSWTVTALPCHDLHLLAEGGGSMRALFKSQQHECDVRNSGIRIINWAGPLNTHAARLKRGGVLVPKDSQPELPHLMMFDASFIHQWREDVRQRCDQHIVEHPISGRTVMLRRFRPRSKWPSEQRWHLFVDDAAVTDTEQPRFSGVIREPHGDLWLECAIDGKAQAQRGMIREFWECLFIWFGKLWGEWPCRGIPVDAVMVGLIYENLFTTFQNELNKPLEAVTAECLQEIRAIRLTIPHGFTHKLHLPTNEAEREIVMEVARALASFCSSTSETEIELHVSRLFSNPDARRFHFFISRDPGLGMRRHSNGVAYWPSDEDIALLHWKLLVTDASRWEVGAIAGHDACISMLESIRDHIRHEIEDRVSSLPLREFVMHALRAENNAKQDEQHCSLTSRALRAVHPPEDAIDSFLRERRQVTNSSAVCIRALIEIAAYVQPSVDQRPIGQECFVELIAMMHLLISLAQHTAMIARGWKDAEISLHPDGSLQFAEDRLAKVIDPFEDNRQERMTEVQVESYEKALGSIDPPDDQGVVTEDSPFNIAFLTEFKFGVPLLGRIIAELENHAQRIDQLVLDISELELRHLISEKCGTSEDIMAHMISTLALPRRTGRLRDLGRFKERDVDPWRFRRGLSLLGCPWFVYQKEGERHFLISVGLLRRAVDFRVGQWRRGEAPSEWAQSAVMKKWLGEEKNRLAGWFENEVGKVLEESGYKTLINKELTVFGAPANPNLGEVDVTAWKPGMNELLIIECKLMREARLPVEMMDDLADFRGKLKSDGKPDLLLKHIQRVNWLRDNQEIACKKAGIELGTSTVVRSLLLFGRPSPLEFHSTPALIESSTEVVNFTSFKESLSSSQM